MAGQIELQARSELWAAALADERIFIGTIERTAVAGQYSQFQFANPVGSGEILYLVSLRVTPAAAVDIKHGRSDTLLTNVSSNKGQWSLAPRITRSTVFFPIRHQTSASQLWGPPFTGYLTKDSAAANVATELIPKGMALRVGEGAGAVFELQTVNVGVSAQFIWAQMNT